MTYKELLQQLQQLNEEQLLSDIAVQSEALGTDLDEIGIHQGGVELVFSSQECFNIYNHPIIRF